MPPLSNNPDKITYFAETDYRSKRIKFGIRDDDRGKHMYIIGKSGMGKSTLLENLAIQDIQNGEGICFIDPHGGTAEILLSYVPEHRIKDVIYFAPFDQEYPVGLNVLEDMGRDKRPLVVSGLMGSFKKVWVDMWSARMEYILNNTMLALMETPGTTLLGVNRMYSDKNYRDAIVANVTDPSVRAFWVDEYAKYSEKFATEATAAIQNKVGQFAANPLIRNMVGQPVSTFDIRKVMDERKIFIVNLSKGRMGEGNANLVGSMLITKIYLAAMSRADVGASDTKDLAPFYLYVDEFQSFANESFADILSEARKYKLALTVAHQYIEQMSDEVRAAVFGNVGTTIAFRVGAFDADVLEKEFAPVFLAEDMVNLGFTQVYMKLMIRGVGSPPFSATTMNRPKLPVHSYVPEVVDASRRQFARPRAEVEDEIRKWHEPVQPPPRDPNATVPPETKKYAPGLRPTRPPFFVPTPSAVRAFTPSVMTVAPDAERALSTPTETTIAPVVPLVPLVPPPTPLPTPPATDVSVPIVSFAPPSTRTQPPAPTPVVAIPVAQFVPTPLAMPVPPPVGVPAPVVAAGAPPIVSRPAFIVPKAPYVAPDLRPDVVVDVSPPPPPREVPAFVPRVEQPMPVAPPFTTVPPQVHQPFKQSFSQIKTETPPKEFAAIQQKFTPSGPPKKVEAEGSAPLSILKSQPKKDKGPSEGNLTSLKEALLAAMASNIRKEKGVEDGVTATPSGESPAAPVLQEEQPVPRFVPTPPKTVPTEAPKELLREDFGVPARNEVPEHVLRGLLED